MHKRLFLSLISCVLVSNISYGNEVEGISTIYVYRPNSFVAIGDAPWIYINGNKKNKLDNNSYQLFKLSPGKHKVVIDGSTSEWSPGRAEIEIDTIAGNVYYVRLGSPGQVDKYYEGASTNLGKAILILANNELAQNELLKIK